MRASRRRRPRSPTTSPTTRTTSTTACAPACSRSPNFARPFPLSKHCSREIDELHPGLEEPRVIHELTRRVITRFIEDAMRESRRRIAESRVDSPEAVAASRRASRRALGGDRSGRSRRSRRFCSPICTAILTSAGCASGRTRSCGACLRPIDRPVSHAARLGRQGLEGERARAVADYIAGMTDRFAIAEHARIFDDASDLR